MERNFTTDSTLVEAWVKKQEEKALASGATSGMKYAFALGAVQMMFTILLSDTRDLLDAIARGDDSFVKYRIGIIEDFIGRFEKEAQ